MTYVWKTAARIPTEIKAQTAGEICEKLEKTGGLSAKRLVDVSRPEDAPLHKAFEWDDAKAAESFREEQARHIIQAIILVPEHKDQPPTRQFVKWERETNYYESVETVMRNESKREGLLKMALRDLRSFEDKYSTLTELAPVFSAIDEVKGKGVEMGGAKAAQAVPRPDHGVGQFIPSRVRGTGVGV